MPTKVGPMSNEGLDTLIRDVGVEVEGQLGFWEFIAYDVQLYCITDESHDRMRVMTVIADRHCLDQTLIVSCMEANYDRALDARYCINDGTLWGAYMHPLSTLQAEQFISACRQVAELSKNYGTTFSSGELRFGG